MKLPVDVLAWLRRRYDRQHRNWLSDGDASARWPLTVALDVPTEQTALLHHEPVQQWIAAWHAWTGPGHVQWIERVWRSLGQQRLPERLVLATADDVATAVGESARWRRAQERYRQMCDLWPVLGDRLPRYFDMLADYHEADFARLISMLAWLEANPRSGLYPRQLPIAGLDTKWLERRQGLIGDLLATIRGITREADGIGFFKLCGLLEPPARARLRLLDAELRAFVGGLGDVTVPLSQLARLPLEPNKVIIVENDQTGLALPDLPRTVAFLGLGYDVAALAAVPWLNRARLYYWGDLDTHGYAILSQFRSRFPQAQSLLMDESTLHAHRDLWGEEPKQHGAAELPGLTPAEQAVYAGLKQQRWGYNVRLEQERIAWDRAMAAIDSLD